MKHSNPQQSESGHNTTPRARARYLHQAIELEESSPVYVINLAIGFSIALLVSLLIWSSHTVINETATSQGEVVPTGLIHNVQHLEGGIVEEILVRNGDRVQPGQLLLRLAPPASQSELDQMQVRRASARLESERLYSLIDQRTPDFSAYAEPYPELVHRQIMLYQAQVKSHRSDLEVVDARIQQRERELERQINYSKALEKELALFKQQVNIRQQLADKRLLSKTELLATQIRLAESQSSYRQALDGISVAQEALNSANQERLGINSSFQHEIEKSAEKVSASLAELDQAMIRLQDRVTRLAIKAPVAGIIQGLSINTVNAVVEPGKRILQIVPVDDVLVAEARVSPKDIGHVRVGQDVDVKVDSFIASQFGSIDGRVLSLSPSTYLDERRKPYYRARISLVKPFVGDDPGRFRVIPGMTVRASITTGSKTLLDYLIRPVTRGFDGAFHER